MPVFAFWNTYRLGGGSGGNKKMIIEGVLAQLFQDHAPEFVVLCEVTSDVQLGDAQVGKHLYAATKKAGQLAYSAFNDDLTAHNLTNADVDDFKDVFGTPLVKKGGGKFSKQSKRPVASAGQSGTTWIYVYHANASGKSAFLVSWVAESLNQDTGGNFILAGDLNCEPAEFNTWMDTCAGHGYNVNFHKRNGGATHNAKTGLVKTYDWAVVGPNVPNVVTVTAFDFGGVIGQMGFHDDPRSDHLPIVISW